MSITIYESFAAHTKLPVKLRDVRDFILGRGAAARIERYPTELDPSLLRGGMHSYYDLAPPYAERPLIVRIGYPKEASEGVQRLIQVKEMLHVLDPADATSPTKGDVETLIGDLLVREAEREIGLAAHEDHTKLLNALCILMPRDALDIIRPAYKRGDLTVDEIAAEAKIPKAYVTATLTDHWRDLAERI
ncbi:hypothetical protein [uncultured Erythrobacter sp.]|uniref:hypothetical protein n=1 Tax=uncultured Erythrobacter sp. TaxID=263913 RepID=UPI002629A3D7|nr:hypothetical protein [uncultured Erythrobacter sp.]